VVWTEQHTPGEEFADKEERVHQAIRAAQAVVLVISSQTRSSRLVKEHLRLADVYSRRLILVWVGDEPAQPQHYGWQETIWVDAHSTQYAAALAAIEANLGQRRSISALLGPSHAIPEEEQKEQRNPYKGRQAFTANDAEDFFGRDHLVDEVVKDIARLLLPDQAAPETERLLTILGPSGSGKSSLVMAGLLPQLQRGALPGSETWIYLESLVPGKHPIEALGLTLARHFPDRSFASLRQDLSDDATRGLHILAMQLVKQRGSKVVLLVDQFEELFTQTESEAERGRFIDLLLTATTEPRGPLLVLLTLRADFSHNLMQYPELYRLVKAHEKPLFPMEVDDLRATIEQPAALPGVQLTFEGNLVGDLLFEMQRQAGVLPLLQFTLDQLFQKRSGHRLTLQAYRDIGGMKGALSQHAEQTYAALPSEEHRRLSRALFVRLIDPGASEQDTTRRRATLSEFTLDDATQTRFTRETIDAFIAARLLTANEVAGTTTIEVSHEALIREWPRLAEWMREARQDIHLQQAISEDVIEWERRNKPADRLYRGSQLKEAQAWARRNTPSGNEVAFLRAGVAQRIRSLINVLAIVLLLMSTTWVVSWLFLRPADPRFVTNLYNDGVGSLRWAIANAPSGSTIMFDAGLFNASLHKPILLTSGNLNIGTKLTILGPGAGILSISNDNSGNYVNVLSGTTVYISGLTFTNSQTTNGFIFNSGRLTLNNSTVSGNTATENGGGINNNQGVLTLNNSTVSGNSAKGGGGIYSSSYSTLMLNNSTVRDNRAIEGGGLDNRGSGAISNSTFKNNSASSGGGISNGGRLTLNNSTILDNMAAQRGGGISNGGRLTLNNSTVSSNTATGGDGGGIHNFESELMLTNSTVSGNMATGNGGGINSIGGQLMLSNTTLSGNTTTSSGGGISVQNFRGGKFPIQVMLLYCTVYGNTANIGGGIWVDTLDKQSQVSMGASIIAGNSAHTGPDIAGSLASLGYNLVGDRSGATFPIQQSTDRVEVSLNSLGIDPVLRDNGGSTNPHTLTHALFPGSLAIDAIPLQYCQVQGIFNSQYRMYTDQRGKKRPDGNEQMCDIGAYEYVDSG